MKILPHSIESEQCVLGSMLIDDSCINLVNLQEEDFYKNNHWIIYSAIKIIYKHKNKCDLMLVKELLEAKNKLISIGNFTYLGELTEITPTSGNILEYVKIVKEKSNRRRLIKFSREVENAGFNEGENINSYLSKIENIGKDILTFDEEKGSDYIDLCDSYEKLKERYNKLGSLGESSPYKELDKITQGIIPGTVTTIVAYSNVGKSNFSYSFVIDALKRGKKVLFFSNEVMEDVLFTNILKYYYNVNLGKVMSNDFIFQPSDFRNLKIYDNVIKLEEIELITKSSNADYIFIDFIQNIETSGKGEYEQMTKVAKDLQRLAIDTGKPIFSVSQANNESRFNGGNKIQPKGSGAIFASSDLIFALSKTKSQNILNLNILKNKNGPAEIDFEVDTDFYNGIFKIGKQIFQEDLQPKA